MSDAPSSAAPTPPAPAAPSGPAAPPSEIQALATEIESKFRLPEGAAKVQRATRLWVDVDLPRFAPLFDYLVKVKGFTILCTITGLDLGADLGLIYHLARDGGVMANVKTRLPKGQYMQSVSPYFPGATIYEREVEDLLGAKIVGKPDMPRYPLPEDWPQGDHPLLKDWKSKAEPPANAGPVLAGEKGASDNV